LQLHLAILCGGSALENWQLRCLEQLLAVPDVRAVLRIELREPSASAALPAQCVGSLPVITLRNMFTDGDGQSAARDAATTVAAVKHIRRHDLSFILSFLDEPCPPALLDAARHGVWAFCFGDWIRYRGEAVGFWEVYEAEPVTAALLVRLRRAADEVIVLREGHLRTNLLSHAANRVQLHARVTHWPAQVCIDIRNGITERLTAHPLVSTAPVRAAPTRAQRLNCRCRIAARALRIGLRSLFRHDQWNVGRIDRPIASFLREGVPSPVEWLAAPRRSEFRADPFGVRRDGRLTIFYELFSYRTNRGTIAAVDPLGGGGGVRIGPQPPVHLSYPYLIEEDGRLLCIPETHEAAEVGLYELERFPDRWVKVADLLTGIPIVDATLFRHGERWWLAGSEPTGVTYELNLWHASAITGPWHPHAANPVKMDVRSARPGGTPFYEDGVLYRPAQDCSATYGGRIIINRVLTLTPTDFREEQAATVEPDPAGPYPSGLHTLSRVGGDTLIDGKRVIFSPPEFQRVFALYLGRLWRRLRH
jgi:hypothetical protein